MMCDAIFCFLLFAFSALFPPALLQNDIEPQKISKECRERDRLITTDQGDLIEIIDATKNEKLILQCHYCNENDDGSPKNWYKIDEPFVSSPHEVQLSMNNDPTKNRFTIPSVQKVATSSESRKLPKNRLQVNKEHSLIIDDFAEPDAGLYYCVGFENQDSKDKFNFLVDIVIDGNTTTTTIESGNITDWLAYHDHQFKPINTLFSESSSPEFVYIREDLKVNMEVVTQWGPWGSCEVCGRPKGEGVRRKKGFCRIKLRTDQSTKKDGLSAEEQTFVKLPAVSCKSARLAKMFPGLSNLTRVVPDFEQQEGCAGVCGPDAEGALTGWKVGKTKGYKYRRSFVLQENSHLTLVCPESTLDNEITWRKNGKVIKPGDVSNPHLIVDTFGTLYLVEVTQEEAGNYTCQVDDIRMQQNRIFVYSKSKILTKELGRYMIYLGFILMLSSFCYCGGLVITCYKWDSFKNYEELKREQDEAKRLLDNMY